MSLTVIRAEIATRLNTVASFGSRVYQNRFAGNALATVPAAIIAHRETTREPLTMGSTIRFRCLSAIEVEIHASGTTVQDSLDTLSTAAIAAIEAGGRTLGADAFDAYCSGWADEFNSEGDAPRGMRTLTLTVEWQTTTS